MGDVNRDVALSNAKYAQYQRTFDKYQRMQQQVRRLAALENETSVPAPPRKPGSERGYTFKSKEGTRYSDKPEPKKGERRTD